MLLLRARGHPPQYELHRFPSLNVSTSGRRSSNTPRATQRTQSRLILSSYVRDILRRICATVEGTLFKELTPQRMRSAVARHTEFAVTSVGREFVRAAAYWFIMRTDNCEVIPPALLAGRSTGRKASEKDGHDRLDAISIVTFPSHMAPGVAISSGSAKHMTGVVYSRRGIQQTALTKPSEQLGKWA